LGVNLLIDGLPALAHPVTGVQHTKFKAEHLDGLLNSVPYECGF